MHLLLCRQKNKVRRCLFILLLFVCGVTIGHATTVTRYHYWIDQEHAHEHSISVSSTQIDWLMNLADLTEGTHTLYYRIQDSEGQWSYLHTWQFFVKRLVSNDEVIVTKLEYWVDSLNTHFTSKAITDNATSFILDASDLTEGTHTLYYRVQDNEGEWSYLHTWQFFVKRITTNETIEVTDVEYWVDADKAHYTTTSISNNELSFVMDLADMTEGTHTLYYRAKDNEGGWSYLHTWQFFVKRITTNETIEVTDVEYWVDADKAHYTTTSISNNELSFVLNLADMTEGTHTLYYRAKDNEGEWSYLHTWQFFVTRKIANDSIVVTEVEYWIDAEKAHYATQTVTEDAVAFSMDLADMRPGLHTLYYRFKDNEGGWSHLHTWQFFKVRLMTQETLNVIQCEYWLDGITDENKQIIAVNGNSVVLSFNTIGMRTGTHTIYYRFKDNEGQYGPLYMADFLKINPYDPVMILPYDTEELNADMLNANPDYMAYPTSIENQIPEVECNNPE